MTKESRLSIMLGAVFIMATSAIGPAFLTQTAVFTEKFLANFAFAILASILIDIAIQLNVWRIIAVTRMRGQEIGDRVFPGMGKVLTIIMVLIGIAFNIGNVAGAGLGINVMFDIDVTTGCILSALFAIGVFCWKDAGKAMDKVAQIMGVSMLCLTFWICVKSGPPVGEAIVKSVLPDYYTPLIFPMITLIGGTVGGYITFAGGHRLLDAGICGVENLPSVNRAATTGILATGAMRVLLFLAVLGVVAAGSKLDPANPPASVFRIVAGDIGYRFFGLVLWCAAVTSIIGCAYTTVSFLQTYIPLVAKFRERVIIGFIVFSTMIFVTIGRPVTLLVIVGSIGALILPLTIATALLGSRKESLVGDYKHPPILFWLGVGSFIITLVAAWFSLQGIANVWKSA